MITSKERADYEQAIAQEIPADDHAANGEIEVAVREIKKQVRVGKLALESKLKKKLREDDPVIAWLPRHSADLINRYRIGEDGKTPEQRRTGKKWRKPAVEFGERIYFKEAVHRRRKRDLEARMIEGRYIGHHARTGALLVITSDGVKKGASFRRLPEAERWTT